MDEPTSVLTPQEVFTLFTTLRKLKSEGTSILYISHKLEEIRELCETASILRGGKKVATCDPREKSARELAEMMVGGTINSAKASSTEIGETILKVSELSLPPQSAFGTSLKSISLNLHKGEVLGIGGVAGNGQDELLACLSGEVLSVHYTILFNGIGIGHLNPNARRALGLLAAPEERLGHAAAPDMNLIQNTMLTAMVRQNLSKNGFLNWAKAKAFAQQIITKFDVRTPSTQSAARSLSGGNLQKFVIGREVLQDPDVFIVNQPTWGVDAAAAASIRQALLDLTAKGAAVVVISQDLDELMEISTRFAVLNNGKLSEAQPMADLSLDEIGLLLGGADAAA
jgi:simple sugar transport system ATP-binding protein